MMYSFDITTPKNTTKSNPKITNITLTHGVIHTIDIRFPPGPSGLVFVRIEKGIRSIEPTNPEGWVFGDDETVSAKHFVELKNVDNKLIIFTANVSTVLSHQVRVDIEVLPKELLLPAGAAESIVTALGRIFESRR